jgi:hypothetical protein
MSFGLVSWYDSEGLISYLFAASEFARSLARLEKSHLELLLHGPQSADCFSHDFSLHYSLAIAQTSTSNFSCVVFPSCTQIYRRQSLVHRWQIA